MVISWKSVCNLSSAPWCGRFLKLRRYFSEKLHGVLGYQMAQYKRLKGPRTKPTPEHNRVIFVSPWNENARTKQKQQTNVNRAVWLVYRTDTNARGFWLVKRTLGWKNFMPEELSRNQPILRFDVILQHDWPIEQCLLHIRVFFGGKTKRPCFDLFIHWLTKQITNTYGNHFSKSYENRSTWQFLKHQETPKAYESLQSKLVSTCRIYLVGI